MYYRREEGELARVVKKSTRDDAPTKGSSDSDATESAPVVTKAAPKGPMSDPWSDNFLILLRSHEGVSHWRYVVNDFFLLALDTNRTLVEPCVHNGMVHPCMHLMANETLTLSSIIDMAIIKNHFPELRIMPWSTYQSQYMPRGNPSILCYKKDSPGFVQSDLDFDSEIIHPASTEGNDASYEDCARQAKNFGNTIYLFRPWKDEVLRRGQALTMTIPWKYAPFQHTIATRIMKDAKIDLDKYFVFNWRMEGTPKKHLIACAKMLVALSEEWLEKFDGDRLNAMLISDASYSKTDKIWALADSPANEAIQGNVSEILTTNFFKIETSNAVKGTIKQFPRYRDPIFLTIWEIIIAEKALLYVSCAQSNEVCDYCSAIKSKFSEDIIRNRWLARLNSYESWSINSYTHTKPVSITEYLEDQSPTRKLAAPLTAASSKK